MNRVETLEIKKQLTPDRCTIDRICGCYVNYEKKKLFTDSRAFPLLPDEEMFKYLDVFRHALSGRNGKNLIDLAFPYEQEQKGGTQHFLMRLRESKLEDEALLDSFYDRVIEAFEYPENYYIILVHAVYDVPGITSDRIRMEDASDNVYDHILCAICPVALSRAGLSYNEKKNLIEDRFRDWVVDMPVKGFLFPSFQDRTSNVHQMLYYTKKAEDIQPDFIEAVFGAQEVMSAPEQKEGFQEVIRRTLGENGKFETVQNLHENLQRKMEEHTDPEEPLTLEKEDVKKLLRDSGVSPARMKDFELHYAESFHREDYPLLASNIAETTRFEMKSPDVRVIVNPERADLVETRMIDGRPCLVIRLDDRIEVNGIQVKTMTGIKE
ncbi:MAG: DUF4317 domain-containing protein [Lachnospiraceae bacterium]|nr:DUF4317 domain-containing protein [Lachnospiraceae bacterium]